MPKKGRHARHVQARATASQNTSGRSSPAPALLDMRAGTPDVAQSVLEQATPEFSIRVERERDSPGQPVFRPIGMEDSLYGSIIPQVSEEEPRREADSFWDHQKPSPLALSPLPAPPLVGDLVPVDAPAQEVVPDFGHVRAPVIPNVETGMLSSISRTVRGVTSALPRALPTAPRVSRPVSFGSFFTNPQDIPAGTSAQADPAAYPSPSPPMGAIDGAMQYGSPLSPHGRSPAPRPIPSTGRRRTSATSLASQEGRLLVPDEVSELALDDQSGGTHYPRVPGRVDEEILFSSWDTFRSGQTTRRVLILGYTAGMQIWDCTDLSSVKEIVNVALDMGKVSEAHVLADPSNRHKDIFVAHRPLLGLIAENSHAVKEMLFYSLKSHQIVHRLELPSQPTEFAANSKYLIISTSIPIALHIYCSTTLAKLFTIPQADLASFTPDNAPKLSSRLSTHLEQSLNYGQAPPKAPSPPPPSPPRPVFALSGRLLAIASTPPRQDGASSDDTGVHPRVRTLSANGGATPGSTQPLFSVAGVSVSQADIGNAAIKVGGGMLSGMRTLGGLAYGAAKAQFTGPRMDVPSSKVPTSAAPGLFASKSAPANYSAPTDSVTSEVTSSNLIPAQPPSGHYVRVIDLGSLANRKIPKAVLEFALQGSSTVANLAFTTDGSCLIVAPKDGQVIKVFKLDPAPKAIRDSSPPDDTTGSASPPQHIYDLRRGRSTGSIERIAVDTSGRWIAVGTRNGTVHVFPVNPYGGPPDARSHLEGRVINPDEPMVSPTNVNPLVRMRSPRSVQPEVRVFAPLAFSFLDQSAPLPSSLRPPPTPYMTPSSPALSLPPSPAQRPVSASPSSGGLPMRAATNYQDLLLFEPVDGLLSLRRATIERKRNDSTLSLSVSPHVPVIGGSSMSLPTMGPLSRMGSSPPSGQGSSPQSGSALSQLIRPTGEVFAREDTVATWHLRRAKDWKEIHQVVKQTDFSVKPTSSRVGRSKWISQAELSTFSRAPRFLPRSTYLAHQFNFFELGHDYHGLIRRFQFDVTGEKIEVRKQVEVSAFPTSGEMGESFHGADAIHGHRRTGSNMGAPSSFDDSISSAISAGLNYSAASPRQLPMYPNGVSGQRSSYRASGPIRAVAAGLGEGVSEGIGRLRRGMGQMGQVRSPTTLAPIQGDVPLEFDEDDLVLGDDAALISTATPGSAMVSEEHAGQLAVEPHGTAWLNWEEQDRRAVDEVEEFDEFVVGDLDEDQVRPAPVLPAETTKPKSKKKKKL